MGLGFIYWGVFVAYGVITLGYILWMYFANKSESERGE